jgi:hypothetical protein
MTEPRAIASETATGVRHRGGHRSNRPAAVIALLGCMALVLASVWVYWSVQNSRERASRSRMVRLLTEDRPFPPEGRFIRDPYAGPRSCAECHPGESALYSRSGHSSTLRAASRVKLARALNGTTVADPQWPEVSWSYRYSDDQLRVARKYRNKIDEFIVDYAFGSGHHAVTFVNMIDPEIPAILEHRLTHFTSPERIGITPGHDARPAPPGLTPYGGVLPPRAAKGCFACHATALSAHDEAMRIDQDTMIPNVSCERCHGPGRDHVRGVRSGALESDRSLRFGPDRWTTSDLLGLCGSCHRHPSGSPPGKIQPDDPQLARFQPVGLMQSKCFQKSAGAINCVSCHDPHARASPDRAGYDGVCLSCHTRGKEPMPARSAAAPRQEFAAGTEAKPCLVSPASGCVECHMPRVDPGQHVLFTDHWIRVRSR